MIPFNIRFFELILPIFLLWAGITQVIIPWYFGLPTFPVFRDGTVVRFLQRIFSHRI